jgi:signal transduction histidine kinase
VKRRLRSLTEGDWRVIDRVLVAAIALLALGDVVFFADIDGSPILNLLLLEAIVLLLLWRRSRPLLTVIGVMAGFVASQLLLTPPPELFTAMVVLITANYSVAAHLHARPAFAGLVIGAGGVLVVAAIFDPDDVIFPVILFCVLPWLAGRTIRNQTMLTRELAEKAERAQHAREDEERRAIAVERSRIARELHDVLAHNLSVMVVQAGAARRIVDRDPGRALESAELIQKTGREALAELRHLFGPVRRGEGEALTGPPSLVQVDGLAQRACDAGLPVELRVEGTPVPLSTGVDLTAYRVVQEALTNALKHAGAARAKVLVTYEPSEVVVEIEDDGIGVRGHDGLGGTGGGYGLVGMRERVRLYGGEFQAGRRRGGGFAVRVRLPTVAREPAREVALG